MQTAKWIERNPDKYIKRLFYENECLNKYFPSFEMKQKDDGIIFIEGQLLTVSNNIYSVKVYYPDDYPYSPPIPFVIDNDVIEYCKSNIHGFHNYGKTKNGLRICVIKPNDTIGTGWKPNLSIIFIISLAAAWLHAYEVKKQTGKWILPEA